MRWLEIGGLTHIIAGGPAQKGVVTYGLSLNRQRPLAGALNNAIFNTWRRFSHQVLYFGPPLVLGYYAMNWAVERYIIRKNHCLEVADQIL